MSAGAPERSVPLRILCVADTVPWPASTGLRRRLTTALQGLAAIGTVDVWIVSHDREDAQVAAPSDPWLRRWRVTRSTRRRGTAARLVRWMMGSLPRAQLELNGRGARADLESWAEPPYDAVWCAQLRTFLWTSDVLTSASMAGPVVLDLADLGDLALRNRRRVLRGVRPRDGLGRWIRSFFARAADKLDQQRYADVQRRIGRRVAAVTVCSELERQELGLPNAWVVANSYPEPEPAAPIRVPSATAPVLLMVGLFSYEPNQDAARFFVTSSFPSVRVAMPGVRLRLVGRHDAKLEDLAAVPGVEVVGEVDDVDAELRGADVVVVPLRYGGGTRVKILEAFAYRVPVVSTAVGCEGLGVEPGEHLLAADDAAGLADACVLAVRDEHLRAELTGAAFALYEARYRADAVANAVADVVRHITASAPALS
jgi:glycosyltransferase involved in cell wall biosynthesis